MKRLSLLGSAVALAMTAFQAQAGDYLRPSPASHWAERVQILYRAEDRSVARRFVRAWDPSPELNLDFVWEPAAGQPSEAVDADGAISGTGRLVWRVKGSASYDPRTIFSTYDGELRNGRPNGKGRLEIRTGEVVDGDWVDGVASGRVVWIDTSGNRYEGMFAGNRPNGEGVYRQTDGEIFTGSFVDGKRDGEGETRLAGGTVYRSTWDRGVETGGNRPAAMADARIGGLLKAQANGGDAGKVDIAVAVEERMNEQSEMKYQHLVRDEDVAIYPTSDDINGYWNGTAQINAGDYVFSGIDWEQSPAFVQVDLSTKDGSRAKLKSLHLDVANSETYRKPMLTLIEHAGCVGFRPDFTLVNHGWGDVRDAKLSVQFTGDTDGGPVGEKTFEMPIANFDGGADVSIKGLLEQAGIDTAKLEEKRYTCQSMDAINVCKSQVFNDVGFGDAADFVWGDEKLYTTIVGKLDYSWADDGGNVYQQSEPIRATIALATIEVPKELAECGDGFGGSPEALRFQDVALQLGRQNYVVDMPVRGNKAITSYTARLKMHAEQSSFHQMTVSAEFTDGSIRTSKPVTLYYFRPRPPAFESTMKPAAACYLPETVDGCG